MSSQNRTGSRRKTITTISSLAIAGALVLTGCSPEVEKGWLPTERGTTSNTDRIMDLWVNSWIAALVVGIITWGLIVWCLVAYRRRKGTVGFPRQTSFNLPLEVFYLTIPLFMVLVFFYFTDRDQQAIDDRSQPADVVVDVRGKQWAWARREIANRKPRCGVHPIHFLHAEAVHHAIVDHGLAAGTAFLGRLEDDNSRAVEIARLG